MIVLGVESSAVSVSAAIYEDDKLLCQNFENNGLTHSVTLLPMIKSTLDFCNLNVSDVNLFAVSAGPGSFTGLRIGAATVKGLAYNNAECMAVSTLYAMAFDHDDFNGVVCPCMDARCSQVYNALFEIVDGEIKRLCEDRAVMLSELLEEFKSIKKEILLVGDGARLCFEEIQKNCPELLKFVSLSEESKRFQRASGVCAAALNMIKNGEKPVNADELMLNYLRLPQAERELKKKEKIK